MLLIIHHLPKLQRQLPGGVGPCLELDGLEAVLDRMRRALTQVQSSSCSADSLSLTSLPGCLCSSCVPVSSPRQTCLACAAVRANKLRSQSDLQGFSVHPAKVAGLGPSPVAIVTRMLTDPANPAAKQEAPKPEAARTEAAKEAVNLLPLDSPPKEWSIRTGEQPPCSAGCLPLSWALVCAVCIGAHDTHTHTSHKLESLSSS